MDQKRLQLTDWSDIVEYEEKLDEIAEAKIADSVAIVDSLYALLNKTNLEKAEKEKSEKLKKEKERAEREERRRRQVSARQRKPTETKRTFIDTHCHLDLLFSRLNFNESYSEFCKKFNYPSSYEGCIAIFCNPETFKMESMWSKFLDEPNIWGAFGCHPHNSEQYNEATESRLKTALLHPKVVALGEIGLDYSRNNGVSPMIQQRVFRRQLKLATSKRLPLVIHSRDASADTIKILKELVPPRYKIHRHCFTGDWTEAQTWLDLFPNLCLGITNVVNYASATEVHEVAKKIPLNRLLLETDAPYFGPKVNVNGSRFSNPGMAYDVAVRIAQLRGIDVEEVLNHARTNTTRIYSI